MPLPLAMMIPFMGIQSMVMAKQFGENFQYGKRRISAMSNEDFNKLTPAKLLSNANDELKSQIPLMKASMEDMRQFQTFIVKEFLLTIRSIIDAGLGKLIGLTPTEINQTVQNIEHFLHGHFEGHGEVPEPTPPPQEPIEIPTEKLIHLTQREVLNMSITQIGQAVENNLHRYDAATQQLLLADYNRRKIQPGEPKDFKEFVPPVIFRVTKVWSNIHAVGRAIKLAESWRGQTNPQRNGNWVGRIHIGTKKEEANNWLARHWPQLTHGQWNFNSGNLMYKIRKSDIVAEQNKLDKLNK